MSFQNRLYVGWYIQIEHELEEKIIYKKECCNTSYDVESDMYCKKCGKELTKFPYHAFYTKIKDIDDVIEYHSSVSNDLRDRFYILPTKFIEDYNNNKYSILLSNYKGVGCLDINDEDCFIKQITPDLIQKLYKDFIDEYNDLYFDILCKEYDNDKIELKFGIIKYVN